MKELLNILNASLNIKKGDILLGVDPKTGIVNGIQLKRSDCEKIKEMV